MWERGSGQVLREAALRKPPVTAFADCTVSESLTGILASPHIVYRLIAVVRASCSIKWKFDVTPQPETTDESPLT